MCEINQGCDFTKCRKKSVHLCVGKQRALKNILKPDDRFKRNKRSDQLLHPLLLPLPKFEIMQQKMEYKIKKGERF